MKHDSESQIQPITTDPLTGEYKLTIPEWMINEYGWYEGLNPVSYTHLTLPTIAKV